MPVDLSKPRVFLLAAIVTAALFSPSSARADDPSQSFQTVDNVFNSVIEWHGIGEDRASAVNEVFPLITGKRLPDAEDRLATILLHFRGLMADPTVQYVCFRSAADFEAYARQIEQDKGKDAARALVRVSYAFTKALHLRAFIFSARKQWPDALHLLADEMRYAPYEPQPYLERGYVLNAQGKPAEALKTYRIAFDLATAHGTDEERANAWRGIGFAQIELGHLATARESFNTSLKFQPGNKTALNELEYIKGLEQKTAGSTK